MEDTQGKVTNSPGDLSHQFEYHLQLKTEAGHGGRGAVVGKLPGKSTVNRIRLIRQN